MEEIGRTFEWLIPSNMQANVPRTSKNNKNECRGSEGVVNTYLTDILSLSDASICFGYGPGSWPRGFRGVGYAGEMCFVCTFGI